MKEVCNECIAPSTILPSQSPSAPCPNTHSISPSQGQALRATQTPLSISPLLGSIYLKHFKQHSLNIFGLEMSPGVLPKARLACWAFHQYRKEPGLRRQELNTPKRPQAPPQPGHQEVHGQGDRELETGGLSRWRH